MSETKVVEVDLIPPFRIHSSLFRSVYVLTEPPFVVNRAIDSLDMMAAEGVVGVCVKIGSAISRIDSDLNPTIKDLIEQVRRMSMASHRSMARISQYQGEKPSPITSLVCMRVLWDEQERTFHFDVQDLSLDDLNDDIPRF